MYSNLCRYEDALQSARLAVDVAHKRMEDIKVVKEKKR